MWTGARATLGPEEFQDAWAREGLGSQREEAMGNLEDAGSRPPLKEIYQDFSLGRATLAELLTAKVWQRGTSAVADWRLRPLTLLEPAARPFDRLGSRSQRELAEVAGTVSQRTPRLAGDKPWSYPPRNPEERVLCVRF